MYSGTLTNLWTDGCSIIKIENGDEVRFP